MANKSKIFLRITLSVLLIGKTFSVFSQNFPEAPNPPRLVNDFENIINDNDEQQLEQKLVNFDNETSTQIAVVTLSDIEGYEIKEYATGLAHKWGIGREDKDNGIIILVSLANRQVTIQTGYGIEGVVPDAIAKRIIENEIKPEFTAGNYYAGIDKAVNTLMSLTRGEYTADEYKKKTENSPIAGFLIIFFIIIIFSIIGKARKARHYSMGHDIPFWLALMMMNNSGHSSRGKFGSFSSGSGSFGGFGGGGGGFGGFGGGGFGGGGASGSW